MDTPQAAPAFTPYGFAHLALLIVTVIGAVLLVRFGRRHRGTPEAETFTRVFAIVQLTVTLGFMTLWLIPPFFDLQQSLPLHLSDVLRLVTAYALWSRRPWAFALTYYWGLTLNPQALLTPDLHPRIAPALELASYWSQHILVMWAAVYLTWGLGLHPSWRSYRLTLAVTASWIVVVFPINSALGTNYGYLNGRPGSASLLNLMGKWPWYLLTVPALVAAVWALITWPWTRRTPGAAVTRPGEPW
ncbi:MAG TPA: TIGR02206 family membrane protein [Propionibacteriaceae bacterium]|nr:TIGR02206 family membrane protein [Propionibacteriaceae bacterium]